MAEPIVRTFVIDTTQAEQNLTSLGTTTKATTAIVDSLYTELIRLDAALNELSPNDAQFQTLATQIKAVEESITSIETGKFQDIATDVQAVGNAISGVDTTNVEQLNQSISNIDTANAVADIENINSSLSSIDASTVVSEVESVNAALDAVDTSNVTGQIENINTEFNNIDSTNVTADINEISTAISGIDASNAVTEITSIDGALTGINTGEVVSEINNIGEAVADINTDNITDVGNAVEGVVAPVTQLASATDQLNTELKDTKVDTSSINNATADFQELVVEQDKVVTSSQSLKQQLRELQKQLAETDPDSAKYRELSQAAGELKDKIQDAAQAVGTQAGGAFERVGGSLGLVTSRIASLDFEGAAEGAKLLAKNITDIKPGDIAKGIQGIGSAFASIGKALLTNPIFLIGAAIAAAIVYSEELLSLVDGITDAETKALDVQKERAALAKEQVDAIGAQEESLKRQGLTEKQITDLKLQALDTAILEQQAVVETTQIQAEAQIKAAERNAEYLKTFLDFVTFPQRKLAEFFEGFVNGSIDILNKLGLGIEKINVTGVFEDVNNFIVKKIFDPEQERKDQAKIVADTKKSLVSLNNQRDAILNAQDAKDKARREKQAADNKAAADKELAAQKANLEKQAQKVDEYYQKLAALEDERYRETLTKQEQEELAIVQKYEALFAAADAAGKDTILLQQQLNAELAALEAQRTANAQAEADKRKSLEDDFFTDLQALNQEKFAAEDEAFAASLNKGEQEELRVTQRYERLFAKADAAGKSTTDLQKRLAAELKAIQEKSANEEVAIKADSVQKGLQLAQGALQVLQAFSDASTKKGDADARKKFKTDKALAIGAATVQTASAVTGALTAGGNPVKLATGAQFVEAGIAAALGLAQIVKIKNSQFGGGATGGNDTTASVPATGGGGDTAPQPAQFNPLASSFLQDRPEQLTPRAYVLAGDVASQQEVREKVQDLARIG